ncbi:MAG: ABC transporter permease, partial [Nitrososphaera sp.]
EILITTLSGLGYILSVGRDFGVMEDIIATMITIFVIGIVFDRVLFAKVEERVRSRWGLNQHSE